MSVLRISNPTLRLCALVLGGEPGTTAGPLLRAVQQLRLKRSERSSNRLSAKLSDSAGALLGRLPSLSGGGRLPQHGRMKRTRGRPVSLFRGGAARVSPAIARVSSASTELVSSSLRRENFRRLEHTRQGRGEN